MEGEKLLNTVFAIYYLNKAEIQEEVRAYGCSWSYALDDWEFDYRETSDDGINEQWVCDIYPRADGVTDWSHEKRTTIYLEPVKNES